MPDFANCTLKEVNPDKHSAHKYIIEHSEYVATIAKLLWSDSFNVSCAALIATALYHDCMKFVHVDKDNATKIMQYLLEYIHPSCKYCKTDRSECNAYKEMLSNYVSISNKESLHNFAFKLRKQMVLTEQSFLDAMISKEFLNRSYKKDWRAKVQEFGYQFPVLYHHYFSCDELLAAVVLCHMIKPNVTCEHVNELSALCLAVRNFYDCEYDSYPKCYDSYTEALQTNLIVTCADILDACTRESGTNNKNGTLDKRPFEHFKREEAYEKMKQTLVKWLEELQSEYSVVFIRALQRNIRRLPNFNDLEVEVKKNNFNFDLQEYKITIS